MAFSIFKDPKKKGQPSDSCKFNSGVLCPEKDKCRTCGWNRAVSERRLELLYDRLMRENPDLYDRLTGG